MKLCWQNSKLLPLLRMHLALYITQPKLIYSAVLRNNFAQQICSRAKPGFKMTTVIFPKVGNTYMKSSSRVPLQVTTPNAAELTFHEFWRRNCTYVISLTTRALRTSYPSLHFTGEKTRFQHILDFLGNDGYHGCLLLLSFY